MISPLSLRVISRVAVAVFYGIADEIAEDPGTGAPVKHTADLCVREADPGKRYGSVSVSHSMRICFLPEADLI